MFTDRHSIKNSKGNNSLSSRIIAATFTVLFYFIIIAGNAQSGNWDVISTTGGGGNVDHGNGVIQLLDNTVAGCQATIAHETTNTYDPTTDGAFNRCYNVYFGCPGNDEIGSDSKGDGLAFSFHKCGTGVGGCGGGLGYANLCGQMMTLEFDTYSSMGTGNFDANYGGGTTGNNDEIALHRNGWADDPGRITSTDAGNLEDGLEHEVCISYDPSTGVMNVDIDGVSRFNYTMATADRLENYFGAGGVNLSWSSGKFGAVNPATVSDANQNDITDNVGGPLCPATSVINSHENGDVIATCGGSVQISSYASPPAGNTVDYVEFFINGGSIGNGTVDPSNPDQWLIDWTPPSNGGYLLRADAHFTPSGTQLNSYDVSVTVTNGASPTVVASGGGTICDGESITLNATGADTYSWDNGAGTGSSVTVSPSTTTTYTVTGTTGGCDGTDQVTVTVNPNPTVTASGGGSICDGENITLSATGADTYSWDNGAGTGSPVTVSPSTTTTYTVTGTTGGCDGTDQVTVTVNPNPTVTASGGGGICDGENITLSATGAGSFSWDNGAGTGSSVTVSPSTTTTYTVTGTTGGCDGTDQVTVTVNPNPTVTASGGGSICDGENITLSATGAGSFSWDNGAGTGSSVTVSPSTTTTYTVTGTTSGCDGTDQVTVTVNALPTANISGDATICDDGSTTNLSINFTGTGPFDIDVLQDGNPYSTESGVTDPHTVAVSGSGVYTITNLSDANCTGTSTTGSATIGYHDDVVATASMECDDVNAALSPTEFQIRVTVTQGDLGSINISELSSHGVTFSDQGGGVWLSSPVNETNTVDINVTDVNDCNGGIDIPGLIQQCSCPASGAISLTGANPVCPGDNSTLEVAFSTTIGTGPFNITVNHPSSGAEVFNSASSPLSVTIDEVGAYSATIEDVGNACSVAATGSVSLSNHTLPTASISGDNTICNDGSTTADLTIDFTGTGPFDIDVLQDGNPYSTESGVTDPHTVAVSGSGVYTITNLSDANCTGTSTTGSATIGYHDDVVATASMECDDVNAALSPTEFQIRVTVTQGDLGSINISELSSHGVTFSDQGGGVWLSSPVNETNTVDINVTDVNDCNGGIDIPGLIQQCSCPASGAISLTGANPVCPGDNSTLEVAFSTTIGTGPFNITVNHPSSGAEVFNSASSPLSVTIDEVGAYSATIEDVGNACSVAATGSVSLSNHTLPTANISGDATICDDGSTTNLSINFTGTGPFDIDVLQDGNPYSSESGVTDPHTVAVSGSGVYTITNLSDANCTGTSTTGSATVSYSDDVIATAVTECNDVNPALAADEFQIRVTVTQGDLASINVSELTAHGVSFSDQGGGVWLSDPVDETNTVDINVTDVNNCNGGVTITSLQSQCSCPTSGTAAITGANPICPGDSTILDVTFSGGTGPFDVTLNGPSGSQTLTGVSSPAQFMITDDGTYTADIINNGEACTASTSGTDLNYTAPVTPSIIISDNGNPACFGDAVTFTSSVSNGGSSPLYEWFINGVSQGTPTSSSDFISTLILDGDVVMAHLISSEACTTEDTVSSNDIVMNMVNPVNPSLNTIAPLCETQTATLIATGFQTGSQITWLLNGSVVQSGTDTEVIIDGLEDAGAWQVEVDNGVCSSDTSTSVNVEVDEQPVISVDTDQQTIVMLGESVTLSAVVNTGSVTWSPADNLSDPSSLNPVFTPDEGGVEVFTIVAVNGLCADSTNLNVVVNEPIKIPNVFTPNFDGENDSWVIEGLESYYSANLEVFNRWGSPVYRSSGIIEWWDGMRNGEPMPVATYYFILKLDADSEPITGSVSLVR